MTRLGVVVLSLGLGLACLGLAWGVAAPNAQNAQVLPPLLAPTFPADSEPTARPRAVPLPQGAPKSEKDIEAVQPGEPQRLPSLMAPALPLPSPEPRKIGLTKPTMPAPPPVVRKKAEPAPKTSRASFQLFPPFKKKSQPPPAPTITPVGAQRPVAAPPTAKLPETPAQKLPAAPAAKLPEPPAQKLPAPPPLPEPAKKLPIPQPANELAPFPTDSLSADDLPKLGLPVDAVPPGSPLPPLPPPAYLPASLIGQKGSAPKASAPKAADAPNAVQPHTAEHVLTTLWTIAQDRHPELQVAAANIGIARGNWVQAGRCPNPSISYTQDTIGSGSARQGNIEVAIHQEIVLGGKLRLDQQVAAQAKEAAMLAWEARRLQLQARVQRGFFQYVYLLALEQLNREEIGGLEKNRDIVQQLVEKAKIRARQDLLGVEVLLEESRTLQSRTQAQLQSAWRQVAAEAAAPELPAPPAIESFTWPIPTWQWADVERRLLLNNRGVMVLRAEADGARLAAVRARAERIPNIRVGGGFNLDNIEGTQGGLVNLEMPLPVWDWKRGKIEAADANLARAQAAVAALETELVRDAAEAWGRLEKSRVQIQRLSKEIVPRLDERRRLVFQAYQVAKDASYTDVLLAEQAYYAARRSLVETQHDLWRALIDLQALMNLDMTEEPRNGR